MTKYWCVNFDSPACLKHGIQKKLWMMQYQYGDDHGNVFQDDKQKSATTRIWRRMKRIAVGDRFVAYLKGSMFFAIGEVRKPRRATMSTYPKDTVEQYVRRKKSHRYKDGYVYYTDTDVFYEDFTDNWRFPGSKLTRYAQRINVDKWRLYVPDGVKREGLLGRVPRHELQMAVFEIRRSDFETIRNELLNNGFRDSGKGTSNSDIPEEILTPELFSEGATRTITVNAYERNPAARKVCIEHYGYKCAVCERSLEDIYGSVASGMVHVHHLTELARIGKTYEVDPLADLRPVCPNCHAVLHRSTPAMSIKKLRTILAKYQQ